MANKKKQKRVQVVSNYQSLSCESKTNLEKAIGKILASILINQNIPIASQKFDNSQVKVTLKL